MSALNETKFYQSAKGSELNLPRYEIVRRDRTRNGRMMVEYAYILGVI